MIYVLVIIEAGDIILQFKVASVPAVCARYSCGNTRRGEWLISYR